MVLSGQTSSPAYQLYRLIWQAVDWVIPPTCACGKIGERWCADCRQQIRQVPAPLCAVCGDPVYSPGLCPNCANQRPVLTALRSCLVYAGSARDAVHRLKYKLDIGLSETMAEELIRTARELNWPINLITSVPLSIGRFKQRGYNQASTLAFPLALALGIPYRSGILQRTRETASQVGLSARDRASNVDGAFSARDVSQATVLIVDDVITTGSTMNACARALLTAGAKAVYGLSFARAVMPEYPAAPTPIP